MTAKHYTRLKLNLNIIGDDFNPDELTKLINIIPTNSNVRGMGVNSRWKPHEWKWCSWRFSTGYKKTFDLDYLTEEFINIFTNKMELIGDFLKKNKCEAEVWIVLEIGHSMVPAIGFKPTFLSFIQKINASIDIDIYNWAEENLPDFHGTIDSVTWEYIEDENS